MKKQTHLHLNGLGASKVSANFHFWVNYSFKNFCSDLSALIQTRSKITEGYSSVLTLQFPDMKAPTDTTQPKITAILLRRE